MATVSVRVSPNPGHVRTARMLAVALARRSGLAERVVDEVRLAVGEATSRAVQLHRREAPRAFVTLQFDDDGDFAVEVTDVGVLGDAVSADLRTVPAAAEEGDLVPGMSLGLLQGLVEDCEVLAGPGGSGTTVRMRWSVAEDGMTPSPAPPPAAGRETAVTPLDPAADVAEPDPNEGGGPMDPRPAV